MGRQTLNCYPLLQAVIIEPEVGRWTASVELASEEEPEDPITLSFDDGQVELVGAIHRGGVESGRWLGRIVGGMGGLSVELGAKAYRAMPMQVALDDILRETGETLAATSLSLLPYTCPHWHRQVGYGARAISELVAKLGMSWRVLRDGTVWVGTETYPAIAEDAVWTELHAFPDLGMTEIAPGEAPLVRPGLTWDGISTGTVVTRLDSGVLRQEVWRASA